jgi:hypothetical protein
MTTLITKDHLFTYKPPYEISGTEEIFYNRGYTGKITLERLLLLAIEHAKITAKKLLGDYGATVTKIIWTEPEKWTRNLVETVGISESDAKAIVYTFKNGIDPSKAEVSSECSLYGSGYYVQCKSKKNGLHYIEPLCRAEEFYIFGNSIGLDIEKILNVSEDFAADDIPVMVGKVDDTRTIWRWTKIQFLDSGPRDCRAEREWNERQLHTPFEILKRQVDVLGLAQEATIMNLEQLKKEITERLASLDYSIRHMNDGPIYAKGGKRPLTEDEKRDIHEWAYSYHNPQSHLYDAERDIDSIFVPGHGGNDFINMD